MDLFTSAMRTSPASHQGIWPANSSMIAHACQDPTSLLSDMLAAVPQIHPQIYFKSSLVALSHAIEDLVLSGSEQPIVFANFQKERYYQQEARRYQKIAAIARQVFVLAAAETEFFADKSSDLNLVALNPMDPLTQEWHLVVVGESYTACLVCRERLLPGGAEAVLAEEDATDADPARQFEGVWSFDPNIALVAAAGLLARVRRYRPDLESVTSGVQRYIDQMQHQELQGIQFNPAPFAERLVTYLQAGQYKLQRTYRAIQLQERKERLVNRIGSAIRRSLDPEGVLDTAAQELGKATGVSRVLLYRCEPDQASVWIQQEYVAPGSQSLRGRRWWVADQPLLQQAIQTGETVLDPDLALRPELGSGIEAEIRAWLVVPMVHQGRLLGLLELHHRDPQVWPEAVIELAEAIGLQVGVALIQAEAFQHLDDLNHQLAALDQAKSDLIAVTGHELRTPLSTIQVCLESLATDPDMPLQVRQEMIDTALQDAGRLRQLVQDFLTLSKLESGRIQWHIEPISALECVELAVSSINGRRRHEKLPHLTVEASEDLPLIEADGEWLVEVIRKVLDNACKFTDPAGRIQIGLRLVSTWAEPNRDSHANGHLGSRPSGSVKITIADTGRGIEPDRLGVIFDRFYQAEGSLRRSVGGTGLGLAISRLIIEGMRGQIWAESAGLGQGSQFHITLPLTDGFSREPGSGGAAKEE